MKHISHALGVDVETMDQFQRRKHKLATKQSIVEINGDNAKMQEMYEYCKDKGVVAFDTETTGLNFFTDRIVLAQIGDLDRQYLIWLDNTDPALLLKVIRDPEIVKIGLNLKFDLTFLLYQYGRIEGRATNVFDVMLSAQVLTCGIYDNVGLTLRMTSMETQAKHWLGLRIPKALELRTGWGNGWDPDSFATRVQSLDPLEKLNEISLRGRKILYAADDVNIPILLALQHKPWIQELDLVKIVGLENEFLPVLADIEARGLPFDKEGWRDLTKQATLKAKEARRTLDRMFKCDVRVAVDEQGHAVFNRNVKYNSPKQMADMIREWMWENCGVEVIHNNAHFREALERTGRIPEIRLNMLFASRMEPDPDNVGKKKKVGYPEQKDTLLKMWDMYKRYLPPYSFILPDTDSKTLKFLRVIYETEIPLMLDDEDQLPALFGLPPALVDPILDLRGESKKVSTYGDNWLQLLSRDGRVHTNFIQTALSTGRLSSSPNAQNLPADSRYRACFKAPEGYKMVGADYSQIEPRVIAHLAQDPTYMRVFWSERPESEGFKKWCDSSVTEMLGLYTEVGKEIGLIPKHYSVLDTKGDEEKGIPPKPDGARGRKQSKVANLGLGYGTGVSKFHYMMCTDTKEYYPIDAVKQLYTNYWNALSSLKGYLNGASALTEHGKSSRLVKHPYVQNGLVTYAETIMGRKRFFTAENPSAWTQGRNMPIQGTAGGDMLKLAAIKFTHWVWDNNIEGGLVNLIHDEFLGEVREEQAEEFSSAMQKAMEEAGQEMCPTVPIKAEPYIEDFWRK